MIKKNWALVVNILTTFAVIFMAISIIGMTMYHSIFNANLYKEALYKSEIYTIVSDIIERNISATMVSWEKDLVNKLITEDNINNKTANKAITFVLNTVVEQQTPQLISNLFDKIALAEIFQNIVEKKIDNDIAWLRGERESREIFNYIPSPEEIEKLKESSFTQVLDQFAKDAFVSSTNKELPECQSDDEINQNITLIANGNSKEITCSSDKINQALALKFENSRVDNVVEKVGSGVEVVAQNSKVNALLDDIYDFSLALAQTKQDIINARAAIQSMLYTSYILFGLSVILGIVAIILQEKGNRTKRFIILLFSTGIFVMLFALLYYAVLVHVVIGSIPFDNVTFSTKALTTTEVTRLVNSLEFIVNYIANGVIALTFTIGVWMTVIMAMFYGLLVLFKNRKKILNKFNL